MILKSHTSDTFSLYFLSFVFCVQFQEDKVVVTICKKIVCKKFHFVVLVPCQVPSDMCDVCVCVINMKIFCIQKTPNHFLWFF